jgi:5-methylcytosine-specific restriction enzyme A
MTKAPRLTTLRPRVAMASQRLTPRPKTTAPIYGSPEWRALIAGIIKQRGRRCEDPRCQTPNRAQGQRVYGDHIIELQDDGAPLDPANVMLRCAPCHGRKTAVERAKRMSTRW